MLQELPDWVLTYGAGGCGQNFPNGKTSDQWFNEVQFAAYTEIGRHKGVRRARFVRTRKCRCHPRRRPKTDGASRF